MKFDYCIGNPPYQETRGGTKNIDVWQNFIYASKDIANKYCFIHPGRWVIPKKQMIPVRDKIIESGLKYFIYFPNSTDVFTVNGIKIDGGISITLFESKYNKSITYSIKNSVDKAEYKMDSVFLSNEFEIEAYNKVVNTADFSSVKHRIFGNIGSLGSSEYGYNKSKHIDKLTDIKEELIHPIKIWANMSFGKGTRFDWHYIEKDELENVPDILFSSRKVMLDKKGHSLSFGRGNVINNIPQIVDKGASASGDVLFVFPENDTDYELQLIKSYFMTKTVRFLMSIIQKDLYVRGFENVPDYTYFIDKLDGALVTDAFLYKYYGFSEELIKHIEECVSEKKEG